ncbi:MAG: large conductance mechanosensitive channel protein MscL [Chloroflexota bacterium]|nr:MAG: large conductance mechanosensitive channel protein MscL [Chloroflexota bacterium]
MFKEFKNFALRGNVLDMAIGIVIGSAFGTIVKSLVNDVIMPPIGLVLGGVDFTNIHALLKAGDPVGPYATLADAQAAGAVTINFGLFINAIISFLIIAFVLFLIVRGINKLHHEEEAAPAAPTTKECPYCATTIPLQATRCPHCTSQLE